jgi:hypothetical protein
MQKLNRKLLIIISVCPKNTLLAKKSTERGEVACLGAAGSRQQQAI